MSPQFDAPSIAVASLHDPTHFGIPLSQTEHRLALLEHWNILPGSKVLELGCGQGDCTIVLAHAVGEQGKVVAVDPADLEYGESPSLSEPAACSGNTRKKQPTDNPLQVPRILSVKPRVTSQRAH